MTYTTDQVFRALRKVIHPEKIKDIVKEENLVNTALGFIMSFESVTTIIPGTKNLQQLKVNCMTCDYPINSSVKKELELLL